MRILIVRHGQAGKADPGKHPDDDLRPLTPKGRKAFRRAAKGLRSLGPEPGIILSSPAARARQTAELLARALGLAAGRIADAPELHHAADPAEALARLSRRRLRGTVALVGHEPWLGEFLSLLVAGDKRARFALDKGGACLVESPSPAKGKGRLHWLLTQEQLAGLA
ncbi:MAG TPA: histidine phosphatase family protein [Fibrobacteria bacterium]|nr:histidine phosphatase family protein [Fibrobacteria bacterium]